jgi:hypothetical protein
MAQWYISIYARLHNGEVELISYTKAANFDVACGAERINLPKPQFYHAENRVGSLLPPFKPRWVKREKYSHKPQMAELQLTAENAAKCIIKAQDINFNSTMHALKSIEPMLTKAQFDLTLKALMRKPSVMKYLYERSE